jgi:hypothetical protein
VTINRGIVVGGVLPIHRHRAPRKVKTQAPVAVGAKVERFADLVGHVLQAVVGAKGDDEMIYTLADGRKFKHYHEQDCCESVSIDDVCGDPQDLVGHPILFADESSSCESDDGNYESCTWTFYRLGTVKGSLVVRWCGSSNGYYSEAVYFGEA